MNLCPRMRVTGASCSHGGMHEGPCYTPPPPPSPTAEERAMIAHIRADQAREIVEDLGEWGRAY